jgi:hypothetical protein
MEAADSRSAAFTSWFRAPIAPSRRVSRLDVYRYRPIIGYYISQIGARPWPAASNETLRAAGMPPKGSAHPAARRLPQPSPMSRRHSRCRCTTRRSRTASRRSSPAVPDMPRCGRVTGSLPSAHPAATLGGAIALVDRLRGAEIEAREAAIRSWGHSSRPRLALMILDELRLILRVVRRRAPTRYAEFVAAVRAAEPECSLRGSEAPIASRSVMAEAEAVPRR